MNILKNVVQIILVKTWALKYLSLLLLILTAIFIYAMVISLF